MKRTLIPMLQDNYCHIIIDEEAQKAVAIDPSEASPLLKFLADHQLHLEAIWNTHHHWDHTGGNEEVAHETSCAVIGAASDAHRIPAITQTVHHGDTFLFSDEKVEVFENPGHTTGAISFYMNERSGERHVYTGDTLFLGGCGRLFEGSPEDMWSSMILLRELPQDTWVHCGHEYTAANLRFAHYLEPKNTVIEARIKQIDERVQRGLPTVPEQLAIECKTNPFLRADDSKLLQAIEDQHGQKLRPGAEAFAYMRSTKDSFRS